MKIHRPGSTSLLFFIGLVLCQPGYSNDWKSTGTTFPSNRQARQTASHTTPSLRVQNYQNSSDSTQAVRQLFQQYKSLDLANSTQIMNLYANDATIDVCGTRYNKTSYGRFIAAAYHNPASGLNSHTVYGEPNIRATADTAQVSFSGRLGLNTMYVYWNLRRNSLGVWQIASEQFTRPTVSAPRASSVMAATSSSLSSVTPEAQASSQDILDAMKRMNDNPDTKASIELLRKAQEKQK